MTPSSVPAAEAEVERALSRFLEEMDAFVASWAGAVRRFAAEPDAVRRFRDLPPAEPRTIAAPLPLPTAPDRDPLWDRELDG